MPRGGINSHETIQEAAKREAREETGMVVDTLILLGEMPPDRGLTSKVVPIFQERVIAKQQSEQEETEAIEEILALTRTEIETAFQRGYLDCQIRFPRKMPDE